MTDTADASEQDELALPDGRLLQLFQAGDPEGSVVLYHHGTPGAGLLLHAWHEVAVDRGVRLVGWSRPGYGRSTPRPGRSVADVVADAAAVADAVGAERFATFGTSGGGPHALACGALLPERVTAVASLAGVAPFEAAGLDWWDGMGEDNVEEFGAAVRGSDALRVYLAPQREAILAGGRDGMVDAMASLLPEPDRRVLAAGLGDELFEAFEVALGEGVVGWLEDDLAFVADWGFPLPDVAVPALVRQGSVDLMVPAAHGRWLAEQLPYGTADFAEGEGHLSTLADLGPVLDVLLAGGVSQPGTSDADR